MPSVLDLPNEVLFKVLDEVESADINVLFQIPELQERLRGVVCLITDDIEHRHHTEIPIVISLDDNEKISVERLRREFHTVVFEVHPHSFETHRAILTPLLSAVNNHIDVYSEDCTDKSNGHLQARGMKYFSTIYSFPEHLWGKSTRAINLNMTDLNFSIVPLTPSVYRFPMAKNLTLYHCKVLPVMDDSRFEIPDLETLTIQTEGVDRFFGALNTQNVHKLSFLRIHSTENKINWSAIPAMSLKHIELWMSRLKCISDLVCPNLESLVLQYTSSLSCLDGLTFPKLKTLRVQTGTTMSINNLKVDSLTAITIKATRIIRFSNIFAPKLKQASFILSDVLGLDHDLDAKEGNDEIIDLSCLSNVESLAIQDLRGDIPGIFSKESTRVTDLMSNLEILDIHHKIELIPWSFPPLKNLSELILQNCVISEDWDLSDLTDQYPSLSYLELSNITSVNEENYSITAVGPYPNLEELHIRTTSKNVGLCINGADLPNLDVFRATSNCVGNATSTTVSLIAPKLTTFEMSGFADSTVDISQCSQVMDIRAKDGIKRLLMPEDCSKLTKLDLSFNKTLDPLKAITLSNVTSFRSSDTPADSLRDVLTPLVRRR